MGGKLSAAPIQLGGDVLGSFSLRCDDHSHKKRPRFSCERKNLKGSAVMVEYWMVMIVVLLSPLFSQMTLAKLEDKFTNPILKLIWKLIATNCGERYHHLVNTFILDLELSLFLNFTLLPTSSL